MVRGGAKPSESLDRCVVCVWRELKPGFRFDRSIDPSSVAREEGEKGEESAKKIRERRKKRTGKKTDASSARV